MRMGKTDGDLRDDTLSLNDELVILLKAFYNKKSGKEKKTDILNPIEWYVVAKQGHANQSHKQSVNGWYYVSQFL